MHARFILRAKAESLHLFDVLSFLLLCLPVIRLGTRRHPPRPSRRVVCLAPKQGPMDALLPSRRIVSLGFIRFLSRRARDVVYSRSHPKNSLLSALSNPADPRESPETLLHVFPFRAHVTRATELHRNYIAPTAKGYRGSSRSVLSLISLSNLQPPSPSIEHLGIRDRHAKRSEGNSWKTNEVKAKFPTANSLMRRADGAPFVRRDRRGVERSPWAAEIKPSPLRSWRSLRMKLSV